MNANSNNNTFSYAGIDEQVVEAINTNLRKARNLWGKADKAATQAWGHRLAAGSLLAEIRTTLKGQRTFSRWLRVNWAESRSSVYKILNVLDAFGGDIGDGSTFTVRAAYLLARPVKGSLLPAYQQARAEAVAMAKTGEVITEQAARALLAKYLPAGAAPASCKRRPVLPHTVVPSLTALLGTVAQQVSGETLALVQQAQAILAGVASQSGSGPVPPVAPVVHSSPTAPAGSSPAAA